MAEPLPCDQDLFDLLVCPESGGPVKWVDGRLISTSADSRRSYRIEGDYPVMLIEESTILSQDDWQALMDADGVVGAGAAAVRQRIDAGR